MDPIGYQYFMKQLVLSVIPHYRASYLIHGKRKSYEDNASFGL